MVPPKRVAQTSFPNSFMTNDLWGMRRYLNVKIKLAILDNDKSYLSRLLSVFGTKYADRLEIYSFTDPDVALDTLVKAKIDVLLASDGFDIDPQKLPNRCALAYLVDTAGIETIREQHAICKFQKADLIYKQILSVYSEKASSITGFRVTESSGKVMAFCAASGGVGSSTMAAACALHFAKQGRRVLYLNLERFGSGDLYFQGAGQFDMSDVIFALKSKKTNLSLKLESCVKQDARGVYFYSASKVALDMMELKADEVIQLVSELQVTSAYDYIILDMDFGLDPDTLRIYRHAQAIVLVGDGSVESNTKTKRAFEALSIMEANADAPLMNRMCLIYNMTHSKYGQAVGIAELKAIGGAPQYAGASPKQVLEQLSGMALFNALAQQ